MKDLTAVLLRPIVTEKSATERESKNKYVFEVASGSNKKEIRAAVEKFFGVKVLDVHTMSVKGKPKRQGIHQGRRADWKKAIVTLQSGDTIDMFDVV